MKKKFVLVNIPYARDAYGEFRDFAPIHPPLGLVTIAGVLEEAGYEVSIRDGDAEDITVEETARAVSDSKPDFVGSSTMTTAMGATSQFYRQIKASIPNTITIVGGYHVSALPCQTMEENPDIDFGVIGEGEETIVELLEALETGKPAVYVDGIVYREKSGVVQTATRAPMTDHVFNRLPIPAYHLLDHTLYRSYGYDRWVADHRSPLGTLCTSRGCYAKCNFCAASVLLGHRIRYYPVERVLKEVDCLVNVHKIRVLYISDDNFAVNRALTRAFCDHVVKNGYQHKMSIVVQCRVDTVNLPTLKTMREAGVRWIVFGVESGNQQILDRMQKEISLDQVRETFALAREMGFAIIGNFMIGHIGETRETALDTINLACELDQDYTSWAIVTPLPGSGLYRYCIENSIALPPWNNFGTAVTPRPIPLNDSLGVEELMELRRVATRRFYVRPKYFLRLLLRFRKAAVISDFLKMYFALRREVRQKRY